MGLFSRKSTSDRANELLLAGRPQAALELCQRACQTGKASAEDWSLYGCLCADSGDLATARTALVKATQLDPALVLPQFALGQLLARLGEYPAAIARLQRAAQLQPDNGEIWLALGITCGLAGQMPGAEEHCRRALELEPGSVQARQNLANALQAQGRLEEAEQEYEAVLGIQPDLVNAWYMLAQARVGLRKLAEAEAAATRALELNPGQGEAHFTLGTVAAMAGDNARARDHFRKAAEYLPGLPDAHMRLGEILLDFEDYAGAADSFHAVVNLDPAHVEAHFLMGKCFEERKMLGRAETSYRKVLALNPDHLRGHYCLAFICARMDRRDEAARHFAEVLRLNPGDEQARHLLAAQRGETTSTAPSAYVATLFDGFADTFDTKLVDELGYRTPGMLHEIVSRQMGPAAAGLDVIDLGCGTGLCAPLFRPMARTLHGIDLSPGMIDKARERALYDSLEVNDIVSSLDAASAAWDLVISSDVFVYVGDLRAIFTSCKAALRPGGWFAFSVEAGDDVDEYILRGTGRYAHAAAYIRKLAAETGFVEIECRAAVLRKDKGMVDIDGYIFLMRGADGNQQPTDS